MVALIDGVYSLTTKMFQKISLKFEKKLLRFSSKFYYNFGFDFSFFFEEKVNILFILLGLKEISLLRPILGQYIEIY